MISYTVVFELSDKSDAKHAEEILDHFADYHPAVARTTTGCAQLILSLPADTLAQATTTALALIKATGHKPTRLEVLTSDHYDRRAGSEVIPELLSVTEVAEQLGITRQAVLQRIESGSLSATRVGTAFAIPGSAIRGTRAGPGT